jgi:Hint domain
LLGDGLPERPPLVSPGHALYFNGVLIPGRLLVNGVPVRFEPCSTVEYYRLELAFHDIICAEGLPSETYLDWGNRGDFAKWQRAVRLFPDFAVSPPGDAREAHGCAAPGRGADRYPAEIETKRNNSWCDIGFSRTVMTPRLAALRSTSASCPPVINSAGIVTPRSARCSIICKPVMCGIF